MNPTPASAFLSTPSFFLKQPRISQLQTCRHNTSTPHHAFTRPLTNPFYKPRPNNHPHQNQAPTSTLLPPIPAQTIPPNFLSATQNITSTAAGLLLLGFIILIHETGHYIAARFQNIKVKSFSIGFGPKLLSFFPSWGKGAEFNLRALPLGGFVAFWPVVDEDDEEDDGGDYESRILGMDVDGGVGVNGNEDLKKFDKDDKDLLQNRPILDRAIVVSAGVIANVMLAYACIFTSVSSIGVAEFNYQPGVVISSIVDGEGAGAIGGIMKGDVVMDVDGVAIGEGATSAGQVAKAIRGSGGKVLSFKVLREGEMKILGVKPKVLTGGDGVIGVQLEPNAIARRVRPENVAKAIGFANKEFGAQVRLTTTGIQSIFMNFKSQAGHLAGPVGVVSIGANLVRNDTAALLEFAAVISLNLAVINALPIPALDGGQMAFLVIEAVKGSPLSIRFQNAVNQTALLLFIAFSGVLLFADLEKLKIFANLQKLFG